MHKHKMDKWDICILARDFYAVLCIISDDVKLPVSIWQGVYFFREGTTSGQKQNLAEKQTHFGLGVFVGRRNRVDFEHGKGNEEFGWSRYQKSACTSR